MADLHLDIDETNFFFLTGLKSFVRKEPIFISNSNQAPKVDPSNLNPHEMMINGKHWGSPTSRNIFKNPICLHLSYACKLDQGPYLAPSAIHFTPTYHG